MTNTLTIEISRSNARFLHELRDNHIEYRTPADDGLVFDSADIYAYVALTPAILTALQPIITAYINRNQNTSVKYRKHDGTEIETNGFSAEEHIRILREVSLIKLDDRNDQ